MLNTESPIGFIIDKNINGHRVKYIDLKEVCQGGPEIGCLLINETQLSSSLFGGPFLCQENKIYLPMYINNFLSSGFKLVTIDLITHEQIILSGLKKMIYLDKIENGIVYFYEDMRREKYSTFLI